MLVLSRKLGGQIRIGDGITVTVLRIQGQTIRLGIEAPRNVSVLRQELAVPQTDTSRPAIHSDPGPSTRA
ncbi:MAG TPA: carbon storage regulator [Isosphaeraceae bacterium]|nr:carbon storage regulator [Isosphaeraceae bacterium]